MRNDAPGTETYSGPVHIGQYPPPRHTVAHLSDTHLLAGSKRQFGKVDPAAGLALALDRLANLTTPPHAVVLTGDLTDLGEPEAYARLRELIEPAAAAMHAEIVWVMGNHDERSAFSRGLFGTASEAPHDRVHDLAGLRVVVLDTTVPGWHHGVLEDEQLAWLGDVLATPAPHGTLLAMHHPPIPLPLDAASVAIELYDQERLAEVIAGTDVRAILAGHLHYSSYSTFAGIPVSVAPASCYTIDLAAPDRYYSGVDGHQAISLVHLYDIGAGGVAGAPVVHTTVPLAAAQEVVGHPSSVAMELERLSAEQRHQLLARKA